MRLIFGLVLLLGIALAGGAVYLAKDRIAEYQRANQQALAALEKIVPTVDVIVAKEQLSYGRQLSPDDVMTVKWPEDAVPEGTFTDMAVLFPETTDEVRRVLRTMEPKEAIMAVKITEPGEDIGLTSRLEKGMRAFTIKVDVSSGVSGFLRPGDRVDVYWTGRVTVAGGGAGNDVTKLIEPGVQLIAIDQKAGGDLTGATIARTVTVAINPQQVAALAQAQSTGRLTLALVGADDDTIASAEEVDQRKLLGIQAEVKEEVVEAPKERVCTIRTRRGAEVVSIPIPCTN